MSRISKHQWVQRRRLLPFSVLFMIYGTAALLATLLPSNISVLAAPFQSVLAAPFQGFCGGNQASVKAVWPGPAAGTVGVCGLVIAYVSSSVGIYDDKAPSGAPDTYKLQTWLQSGQTPLTKIKFDAQFRWSCQYDDGTWRFTNVLHSRKTKEFSSEDFVQEYVPKVDIQEFETGGGRAECRPDTRRARVFFHAITAWNLRSSPCSMCEAVQFIDR